MGMDPDSGKRLGRSPLIDLAIEVVGYGHILKCNAHPRALLPDQTNVFNQEQIVGVANPEASDLGRTQITLKNQLGPGIGGQP